MVNLIKATKMNEHSFIRPGMDGGRGYAMSIKIPDQIENILINIHNVGDGEHTYDHQSGIGAKYKDGDDL